GLLGAAPEHRALAAAASLLELQVLVRRRIREQRDEAQARLLDARTDPVQEAQLPERRVQHAVVGQALDLLEQGLAPLGIELARLLDEEIVHVGVAAE